MHNIDRGPRYPWTKRRIRFEPVLEFTLLCYDRPERVFSVIV
jgi:hypothetical protein